MEVSVTTEPNQDLTVDDLFRDHHKAVYLAAYRVSGTTQDAEDVLQTIFLRLLKRSEPTTIGDDPARYLCRAAINASLDILRSRRRNQVVDLDERRHEVEISEDFLTRDDSADKDVRQAEHKRQLRAALLQLNPRAAEIFVLRYFEEFTNADIAKLMDTSASSIAVTLHRTRDRLQELLREFGGLDP